MSSRVKSNLDTNTSVTTRSAKALEKISSGVMLTSMKLKPIRTVCRFIWDTT